MGDQLYNVRLTASDETLAAFQSVKNGFGEVTSSAEALKGVVAGLSTGVMVEFVKSGIEAVNQVHEMSIKANASVESLSAMRLSAAETGTSMDSVATAIAKLNKSIGEAQVIGGPKADLLKTLGIDISVGRDAGLILFDLSKKLADMSDKQAATYVTSQLMSRGYTELAPFLEKLAQQHSLVAEVTTKEADEANKLNDRIVTLHHSSMLLAENPDLVNSLNGITAAMVQAQKESGTLTAIWVGMGGAAANILGVDDASKVKQRIDDLTQSLSVAQKQLDSGSLKPGGTGKSFFSFLVPDIELSDQGLKALRENIAGMKAELLGLRYGQDYAAPAAAKGDDASGAILNAKKIAEAAAASQRIIDIATREDAATTASHEDAFFKWLDKWKQTEDKLTELGASGTKARMAHEAAYTVYVNAENTKRNAAAATEAAVNAAHLQTELINENAYFAKMQAMADAADVTWNVKKNLVEQKRFEDDIIVFQKHYDDAVKNHALSLAEEEAFDTARDNIIRAHQERQLADGAANAKNQLANAGTQFRAMFELNKLYNLSMAISDGYLEISAAAKWGAEECGYIGGIAAGVLAAADVAARVMQIEGAKFGGGTGSFGSGGGSGGAPITTPSPLAPASLQNYPAAPIALVGVAAQAPVQYNIYVKGAAQNPDALAFSYSQFVEIIDGINQAGANGHTINATMIAA
jgi:hypothetical protein